MNQRVFSQACSILVLLAISAACTSKSSTGATSDVKPIADDSAVGGSNSITKSPLSNKTETPVGNIDDLKIALKDIPAIAAPYFKQAEKLKYTAVPQGNAIFDEECASIEQKISANYTINPFKVIYENGAGYFSVCTDSDGNSASKQGIKVLFLDGVSIKSQFGLSGTMLLQRVTKNLPSSNETLTTLLLDQNYRIIEVSAKTTMTAQKIPLDYVVRTFDADGNYYSNEYFDLSFNKPHAFTTHQLYISADGKYHFQQDLNPRRQEKGPEHVLSHIYIVANETDWDSHSLILTHAWSSGFYNYGGILKRQPEAYSFLHVNSVNGQEVCVDGSSSTKTTWTKYPSPTASFGFCSNDW